MRKFHKVMQQYRVGLLYKENEIVAMLDDSKVQTIKIVAEAIMDEFEVSLDVIIIEPTKEHWKIKLRFPLEFKLDKSNDNLSKTTNQEKQEGKQGWIQLTDRFYYIVEDGLLKIGNIVGKTITPVAKIDYEKVKQLYNRLPEKSTTKDLIEKSKEIGLNIPSGYESFVLRIFSRYVDFDAELEKRGKRLYLIKNPNNYLRKEVRRKLQQEREVIGNINGVGGFD